MLLNRCFLTSTACEAAVEINSLKILKALLRLGCPFDKYSCLMAVKTKNMKMYKFLRQNNFPFDEFSCKEAAINCDLHFLKKLKEDGCPWDSETLYQALKHGDKGDEMFNWIFTQDFEWDCNVCIELLKLNKLDMIQLLFRNHSYIGKNIDPFVEFICQTNNYHIFDMIHELVRNSWFPNLIDFIAKYGNMEYLEWALIRKYKLRQYACLNAALNGHFNILKCPWSVYTCSNAALKGHFEILKWTKENGCMWNEWVCCNAAANGNLEMLKWSRENDCPWDIKTLIISKKNHQYEVYNWTLKNGCLNNANIYEDEIDHLVKR